MEFNLTPNEIASLDATSFARAFIQEPERWTQTVGTITAMDGNDKVTVKIQNSSTTVSGVRYMNHVSPKIGSMVILQISGSEVYVAGSLVTNGGNVAYGRTTKTALTALTTSGQTYLLSWGTPTSDAFSMWTSGSNGWIIPFSGIWTINATVAFTANTAGYRDARINKNGSLVSIARHAPTATNNPFVQVSSIQNLTKGDVITVEASQTSGGSIDAVASGFSEFSIVYNGGAS